MEYNFYKMYETVPKIKYDPENPEHAIYKNKNDSLLPAKIVVNPESGKYDPKKELQRTCSGMAVTNGGRIYCSYFTSGEHQIEGNGAYDIIFTSDDNGKTFQNRIVLLPPVPETTWVFDISMMIDNDGRLIIFYAQSHSHDGRMGAWMIVSENPDDETPIFSEPKRIGNGIPAKRAIILKNGDWILPICIWHPRVATEWNCEKYWLNFHPDEWGTNVYKSADKGKNWERIANVTWAFSNFDESEIQELSDGTLKMMIRGMNCIGESYSKDGGYTWTIPHQNRDVFRFPDTRFVFSKLRNGHLIVIGNYKADMYSYYYGRNNLTAMISKDDGKTWEGFFVIDEREGCEQPEVFEGTNGFIYVSYGRAPCIAGESLLAIITEEDILAGKIVNPASRLRIIAGKSEGMKQLDNYPEVVEIAKKYNIEL